MLNATVPVEAVEPLDVPADHTSNAARERREPGGSIPAELGGCGA